VPTCEHALTGGVVITYFHCRLRQQSAGEKHPKHWRICKFLLCWEAAWWGRRQGKWGTRF